MSPEVELLKNVIELSKKGNEDAATLLRQICISAMEKSPLNDLVYIGECLCRIGEEATRVEASRN